MTSASSTNTKGSPSGGPFFVSTVDREFTLFVVIGYAAKTQHQPGQLLPFAGTPSENIPDGLPFRLEDYIALVELTGRHFHPNKRGKIDGDASPILSRVGLEQTDWNTLVSGIETEFKTIVSLEKLMAQRKKNLRCNTV